METTSSFSNETKLHLAQIQVENLLNLLKGNPYENYMCGKLHGIKYELQRQLNNLTNTNHYTKIKE